MPAARSSISSVSQPNIPLAACYNWWSSILKSLSEVGVGKTSTWSVTRLAEETRGLAEASAQQWRKLAEFQMNAANEALAASRRSGLADLPSDWTTLSYNLAASEAERRREAFGRLIEAFWPGPISSPATQDAEVPHA